MSEHPIPEKGSRWVHYKMGTVYVVVGHALIVDGPLEGQTTVLYKKRTRVEPSDTYARSLDNFMETIEVDGEPVRRFTPIAQ